MLEILQFYVSGFWVWLGLTLGLVVVVKGLIVIVLGSLTLALNRNANFDL